MNILVDTLEQIADFLIQGAIKSATSSAAPIPVDLSRLDAEGQYLARTALDMWSSATGIKFEQVSIRVDPEGNPLDRGILFEYHDSTDNPRSLQSFLQEIGHALGLGHAGDYNGAAVTYQAHAKFANDTWQSSLMSYFGQGENNLLDAANTGPSGKADNIALLGTKLEDLDASQFAIFEDTGPTPPSAAKVSGEVAHGGHHHHANHQPAAIETDTEGTTGSQNPVDAIEGRYKLNTSDPIKVYLFKKGDIALTWYYARNRPSLRKRRSGQSSRIWKPSSTSIFNSPPI